MSDLDYLPNHRPNTLYLNPGVEGVYATLVSEDEVVLGEIEITSRSRIAVSAFHIKGKGEFGTFKITKLKYHKTFGWQEDGAVRVNPFEAAKMKTFVSILASIDLKDSSKARIALGDVQIEALSTILSSSRGSQLIKDLSASPELHGDIYAVAAKRNTLAEFEARLGGDLTERQWQNFFEANTWIFGHGLNYRFLDRVSGKLEVSTTGKTFNRSGKTADGLMRTLAEVSQFVLVEIKRSDTQLLQSKQYRPGCWAVSSELSDAVTQVQKTVFEFSRDNFRTQLKDALGNDLGQDVYAVEPRSYLVIGKLDSVIGNDDRIACFELYRRNIRSPEILTFDELYQRARCIVDNISVIEETKDEVPF